MVSTTGTGPSRIIDIVAIDTEEDFPGLEPEEALEAALWQVSRTEGKAIKDLEAYERKERA